MATDAWRFPLPNYVIGSRRTCVGSRMSGPTDFVSKKPAATASRDEDPAVLKAANSLANGNYGNYGRVFNDFDGCREAGIDRYC